MWQQQKNTAELWRYSLMASATQHHAQHEAGIIEVDETFFMESIKSQRQLQRAPRKRAEVVETRDVGKEQIPTMVARDRERNTAEFQQAKLHGKHIRKALLPLIDQESVPYTDGAARYDYFSRTLGIPHHIAHSRPGLRVRQNTIPITAD